MQSNYEVRKFKKQDWFDIEPKEEARASLEFMRKNYDYEAIFTKMMPFFTFLVDGEIILIYGCMDGGCRTYYPMLIPGKNITKYKKTVVNLCYQYYAKYIPVHVTRLEAYCDLEDPATVRFAKYFGFDIVGIRHAGSAEGHDQAIMERLMFYDKRKVKQ